jgi:hypothetical protein
VTPQECIAALDQSLAVAGEPIKLRRSVGNSAATQQVTQIDCLACVLQGGAAQALVSTYVQGEYLCIISPTEINAKPWPGGQAVRAFPGQDDRIPDKNKGDQIFVRGAWRAVQSSQDGGVWLGGTAAELVRMNVRVKG